jgi:hypothetical protein
MRQAGSGQAKSDAHCTPLVQSYGSDSLARPLGLQRGSLFHLIPVSAAQPRLAMA